VEDIGGPRRSVRLLDLGLVAGRVTQGIEQATRVAPDATRIGGGAAVERDPHERVIDSARRFAASPGNARKAT
jgi:hypothetical protein